MTAAPARAYAPDAAATVARAAATLLPGGVQAAGGDAAITGAVDATLDADAADPEGALVRHRWDVAAADSAAALGDTASDVTGSAPDQLARAASDLRTAWMGGTPSAIAAALARCSVAACDLADPFLTTAIDPDEDGGLRARFSDALDAEALGAVAAADAASAGDATDGPSLARASAAVRPEVADALARDDAATWQGLRAARLAAALGLVGRIVQSTVATASVGEAHGLVTPVFVRAWPNPARDVVTLHYALPAASAARIEVLDVTGRAIAVRSAAARAQGPQSYVLGADVLRALPPGAYFVRVRARDFDATARVVHVDR